MDQILEPNIASKLQRTVYCEDAVEWLRRSEGLESCSLVTSLPDLSEFPGYSLAQWSEWFVATAALVLSRSSVQGVTVFFQSDIRSDGSWVDKGFLCHQAATLANKKLIWHKIACRFTPGQPSRGRAGYSHILCFAEQSLEIKLERALPDVLPSVGEKAWERGMGLEACLLIAKFIADSTASKTIVNPFCGHGSMLAAANAVGLSAIGIERSPKRAELASRLTLNMNTKRWE